MANDIYKKKLKETNNIRIEHYRKNIPNILNDLLEANNQCSAKIEEQIKKYALNFEKSVVSENHLIKNPESEGGIIPSNNRWLKNAGG